MVRGLSFVMSLAIVVGAARTAFAGDHAAGTEPCHLLCVNAAGRTNPIERMPERPPRVWLRLQTVGLTPLGLYTVRSYRPMPSRGEAYAVQAIPSLTVRVRENLLLTASFPWEYNQSRVVVLPTLLVVDKTHQELAPGRLSGALSARMPVDFDTAIWLGVGGAVSDDIGTIDVKDDVHTTPETGIEALGVGTDDLFLTAVFVPIAKDGWEASIAFEGRVHILDNRMFGTTSAYSFWMARRVSRSWSAGLRASGFRTILPVPGVQQSVGLALAPTLLKDVSEDLRVTFGVAGELPGRAINENALQTVSVHGGIEYAF